MVLKFLLLARPNYLASGTPPLRGGQSQVRGEGLRCDRHVCVVWMTLSRFTFVNV